MTAAMAPAVTRHYAILDEAASRDIPSLRLDRHSLVQLGHGVHQQRIRATMTSATGTFGFTHAVLEGAACFTSLAAACARRLGCHVYCVYVHRVRSN